MNKPPSPSPKTLQRPTHPGDASLVETQSSLFTEENMPATATAVSQLSAPSQPQVQAQDISMMESATNSAPAQPPAKDTTTKQITQNDAPLVIQAAPNKLERMVLRMTTDEATIQTGENGTPQVVASQAWLNALHEAISLRRP